MMNNSINLEIRRQAMAVYLRYCEAVYAADAADFLAAREILTERKERASAADAEAMYALEGDIAIWATENASIRARLMNDFAEAAMALAKDYETTVFPEEILRVRNMDDRALWQYIASQVEHIKMKRRMRGIEE